MTVAIENTRRPYELHVRLTDACRRGVVQAARQLHLTASATVAVLVEEALQARRAKAAAEPSNPEELQLQVLVGVEQLLSLMESIHPDGPGVAAEHLPLALAAAKRRITGEAPA